MRNVVQLHEHQETAAWRNYRRRMGNASEAAALMASSPWFPRTPHDLWLLKTERAHVESNHAMRRGRALEPIARHYVERMYDEVFEPQVVARERLSASLDGLSFDGKRVLEIKCPLQGRDSQTWREVADHGRPPAHYLWQVQQQLYCADAEVCHFVVCDAEGDQIVDSVGCEVTPDPAAQAALIEAWNEFFVYLDQDTPPPARPEDVQQRDDRDWRDAVAEWREARYWLEEARRAETAARKALIDLAGERSSSGAGIKLTRYWKRGDIDWRRATAGMDLEPYRKKGGWHYRISDQE